MGCHTFDDVDDVDVDDEDGVKRAAKNRDPPTTARRQPNEYAEATWAATAFEHPYS
jgi:hypothetical protein